MIGVKCFKLYMADGKGSYVVIHHLGLYSYQRESGFQEAHLNAMMETFHNENPSRCVRKIPPFPTCPAPPFPPPRHTHSWGELGQDGPSFSSGLLFLGGGSVIYGSEGRAHHTQLFQLPFPVSFQGEGKPNGV